MTRNGMYKADEEAAATVVFPPTLDTAFYRSLWPDLADLSDQAVEAHFRQWGEQEGRRCNRLKDRSSFAALIPETAVALEIGPFCRPLLNGPNAKFFDVLDQEGLEKRARDLGIADPMAPRIDFVSPTGELSVVNQQFDYVISSHCIEHQPDLIHHLQQVGRVLRPGGCYLMLVPDKRYCFDSLLAESNIGQVLEAHHERRKVHTLRSVIEHRALTTHNDSSRHWQGSHGHLNIDVTSRILAAVKEFGASIDSYIDVHAWYFTPSSMRELMQILYEANFVQLRVERVYPTRKPSNEFWIILRKR